MLAAGAEPELHAKTKMEIFVACCPPEFLGCNVLALIDTSSTESRVSLDLTIEIQLQAFLWRPFLKMFQLSFLDQSN